MTRRGAPGKAIRIAVTVTVKVTATRLGVAAVLVLASVPFAWYQH